MKSVFLGLWRVLRKLLLALAAVVIAIEEWGWRPLTSMAASLAKWPPIGRLEDAIRASPRRLALLLFLAPAVLLFPIKLLALWLIHIGRTTLGVVVILLAKALGTAFVGRLFILTEPQLTSFPWFARALAWWRATKRRVKATVQASLVWQMASRIKRRVSVWMRRRMRGASAR